MPESASFVQQGNASKSQVAVGLIGVEFPADLLFYAAKWGAVLRSESFQQKVPDRLRGWKERRREIKAVRAAVRGAALDRIVGEIGRADGLKKREVLKQRGRSQEAKGVALTLALGPVGLSFREFGGILRRIGLRRRRAANSPEVRARRPREVESRFVLFKKDVSRN
jgi:ferric-dicitrate binding protein FerR (iron transport regulator)